MREDELDFLDKEKKKEKEKKKKHSASGRGQIGWYIKKICGFANDGLYRLPSILLSFPKEFTSFANKVRLENSRSRLPSSSSLPNRTVLLPLASSDKDSLPVRGMQNYFQQWNRGRDFPRLRASWTPIANSFLSSRGSNKTLTSLSLALSFPPPCHSLNHHP